MEETQTVCTKCVLDITADNICFDENGVCNYCKLHDQLSSDYPINEIGRQHFESLIQTIKKSGKGKEYDCIVGVSGGVDSSYLLILAKQHGLKPLAVNVENGWNSQIAVQNIRSCLEKLNIDLRTYVIDWEEVKGVHKAFMKASLPWPDGTTDAAITAALYKIAAEEKIKYVLIGHDFRTEGKQPTSWTHTDGRMIGSICKANGIKLKSFPYLTILDLVYYGFIRGIKNVRPYWFIPYSKIESRQLLEKEYGWKDYGGHHHENIFSKYIIGCWLPQKFGIDKRKVTYSAHIRSGEMTRQEALEKLQSPPYDPKQMEEDRHYIIQKLDMDEKEFDAIWNAPNKSFKDYPSYYPLYLRMKGIVRFVFSYVLPFKPMMSYDLEKPKTKTN